MDTDPVLFRAVNDWDHQEIVDLYESAGWWDEGYDPEGIGPLIRGSFLFVVGISRRVGKAVAMGRIISDHVQTGYIQDLCVLQEMRGHGIGSRLLAYLTTAGRRTGLDCLYLVAEPGTCSFYEISGYTCNDDQVFLLRNQAGL